MSGVSQGKQAVAEKLWQNYVSEHETSDGPEAFLDQASLLIDAWLKASNPVGQRPSESIYDDFYRLRAGARLTLMTYDESRPIDDAMEALRGILIATTAIDNR